MPSDMLLENYKEISKSEALYKAQVLGCDGFHKLDGSFYPCKNQETLLSYTNNLNYDSLQPSTFETIDIALFNWVDGIMDVHATTNEGWKKVPIVWATQDRAYQIKSNKDLRSKDSESLIFPLISIERANISKTPSSDRPIPANINYNSEGTSFVVSKKIKQDKTSNFARATSWRLYKQPNFKFRNKRIVYQHKMMPLPIYHNITYDINIRTEYQAQMNEIMAPFMVYAANINLINISANGHEYEAFINTEYGITNNISDRGENEKIYESKINIKVLGYIMGADKNTQGRKVSIFENAVDVKFNREHTVFGDINDFNPKQNPKDYRP
jgi:hypothetical protein